MRFKDETMETKHGTRNQVILPKRDLSRSNSEWTIDEGNNRIYNTERAFQSEFERLAEGQPKENLRAYEDFLKRTKFEGISMVRRLNYLRALRVLKAVIGGRDVTSVGKEDIDDFLDRISHYSAGTIQIRFYCLKKFLQFIGKAELLAGVKLPKTKDIKVKASDLLTRDDLSKLMEVSQTVRAKAFIMMLYESGARVGEILNVALKDMEFDANGVRVSIEGKTGRRTIRLVESAQLLRDWISIVKKRHPQTPYLWCGVNGKEPSKYGGTSKFLKETAKAAGLRKKVYPHLFRHSRASELAQKLKESQLRAFMGWDAASDMPRVYIHLSAQDVDNAILDLYKQDNNVRNSEMDEMAKFYQVWKSMKAL